MLRLAALTLTLAASGSDRALTIDEDVFSEPARIFDVCWIRPRRSSKRDLARLASAMAEAARRTQPGHIDVELVRIRSRRRGERKHDCRATIDVTAKGRRSQRRFLFDVYEPGRRKAVRRETVGPVHARKISAGDLSPAFEKIWEAIAPHAPPPPEPEPEPVAFVDEEIEQEREELAPVAPAPVVDPRPRVTAELWSGLSVRGIAASGAADAQLLSFGGAAQMHVAPLLALIGHELDAEVGYQRLIANAARGDERFGVNADRFFAGAAYRYVLPHPYLPRVGGRAGYELLRFEVDDAAEALSVRYGVVRAGPAVVQPLFVTETFDVSAALDGAVRWTPGADEVSALGWDAGARVTARWRFGLHLALFGRVLEQRGTVVSSGFVDRFIDGALVVGWSL